MEYGAQRDSPVVEHCAENDKNMDSNPDDGRLPCEGEFLTLTLAQNKS